MERKERRRGFTLVELIVVTAVIAIHTTEPLHALNIIAFRKANNTVITDIAAGELL